MYIVEKGLLKKSFHSQQQAADQKLTSNNIVRLRDVNESSRLPSPRRDYRRKSNWPQFIPCVAWQPIWLVVNLKIGRLATGTLGSNYWLTTGNAHCTRSTFPGLQNISDLLFNE